MAEHAANNTENVSAAKGVKGGYIFSAPIGTTVPTDYTTALSSEYTCLGYITEDGVVFTEDLDNEEVKDMNGDVIDTLTGSRTETCTLTLAETKASVLEEVRGHSNVTDEGGLITVKHNSNEREARVYVLELLLKNGRQMRTVVPNGKVDSIGDTTLASNSVLAYEISIKCRVDANGDTAIDYIESTETKASDSE
jgi:hypothetical protein